MSREDIINTISLNMPLFRSQFHIRQLGVFGSVARGEQTDESDVDILVEFDSPVGFFEFIRLENQLSKTLDRKVDLVSRNALKPSIKEEILNETIYV
jgi:predicted nucleotidyltransferase